MGRLRGSPKSSNGINGLIAAVVMRAINDYELQGIVTMEKNTDWGKENLKKQAAKFLKSEDCGLYCEFLGLDYVCLLKKLGIELPKWLNVENLSRKSTAEKVSGAFRVVGRNTKKMA